MLTIKEFENKIQGGESRLRPGKAVWYILLDNFYAEEVSADEDYPSDEFIEGAYNAYIDGEREYVV